MSVQGKGCFQEKEPAMSIEGKHAYDGSCKPGGQTLCGQQTFSVGIFQWVPKASGGLKKSKVKVRVYGSVDYPDSVYDRAEEIVRALDAGTYDGPKSVRVK
jgi:hypothetical protein